MAYTSRGELLVHLKLAIIGGALDKHNALQRQKAREVTLLTIDDLRARTSTPSSHGSAPPAVCANEQQPLGAARRLPHGQHAPSPCANHSPHRI